VLGFFGCWTSYLKCAMHSYFSKVIIDNRALFLENHWACEPFSFLRIHDVCVGRLSAFLLLMFFRRLTVVVGYLILSFRLILLDGYQLINIVSRIASSLFSYLYTSSVLE
jgi:hypothetical protein